MKPAAGEKSSGAIVFIDIVLSHDELNKQYPIRIRRQSIPKTACLEESEEGMYKAAIEICEGGIRMYQGEDSEESIQISAEQEN